MKCASSSRVPSLGAWRVMLQGVSRRARVAAAELAGTRGDRKMCRETENVLFNDEDVAEFNDVCHHIFTTVSVSRHIRTKMSITSRPARVWRVTRPEPEATRATHRQETKMPTSEQDVRMVMWTAKMSTSCCGHLRLRFRLLAMEKMIIASRRRHPIPAPHLPHRLTSCGTSHRGAPRANRTARTASSDPPRTQSQPPRRGTETCTER